CGWAASGRLARAPPAASRTPPEPALGRLLPAFLYAAWQAFPPRPRALERVTAGADRHRLRGFLRTRAGAEDGVALRARVSVVPPMLVDGAVAANGGRLCARTWVNASYPEASLIAASMPFTPAL